MGSGTKRKKKDKTIIRTPEGTVTSGIGPSRGNSAADICPVSFDFKINPNIWAIHGASISLTKNGSKYLLRISGEEIGVLNQRLSAIVTNCDELGIRYTGRIVIEKEVIYARFHRIA